MTDYASELVRKQNIKRARETRAMAQGMGDPELYEQAAGFYEAAGMDNDALACRIAADICRGESETE